MYIVVGSITMATRLSRVIEKNTGLPTKVVHTPSALREGGCSYSVYTSDKIYDIIHTILSDFDIHVKGIYIEKLVDGEREYRDIS